MSNKKSMSHNACYASPLSKRAVPIGFNLGRARFPVVVLAHSDVTKCRIFFYQYHGMYWYCLGVHKGFSTEVHNSCPFVSMRNATVDCAALLRSLNFVNDTPLNFRKLVKIDQLERSAVAAELNKPITKWI